MPIEFKIQPVSKENFDLASIAQLVRESASEGYEYLSRFCNQWLDGSNCFDRNGEAFFAAECEGKILGIGGRNIDPYADDPKVLRVRRLYVSPEWRHVGMGSQILKNILDVPAGMFHKIHVRTLNPAARKFYESHGFTYVGEGNVTYEREL